MTPLERVERLYDDLVAHYHEGDQRELRAAVKLLLVALDRLRRHGGPGWDELLDEYVQAAKHDPERLRRMLEGNRGVPPNELHA